MLESLITAPLRLGLRATVLVLEEARSLTERALELFEPPATRPPSAAAPRPGSAPRPTAAPAPGDARPAPPAPAPAAPAPASPPVDAPADPPAPPEPVHVSTEEELVAEVADPGAEDGAGAEVHVEEPWEGYRAMSAGDIVDRLATASRAELAAVELYELAGRGRKSVMAAAQRALKQASSPRPRS